MKDNVRKFLPLLFLLATILMVVLGIVEVKKQNTYIETTATITEINSEYDAGREDYDYTVIVKYTVDGKEYESKLGSFDNSMAVGKEVTIRYNSANPAQITQSGSKTYIIMFCVAAACLIGTAVTGAMLVMELKKSKENN